MKTTVSFLLLMLIMSTLDLKSQIVLNEINPAQDRIEIKNLGNLTVNIGSYILCTFPVYNALNTLTLESGSLMLAPGELVVVSGQTLGNSNAELGLYLNNQFTNPASIIDYMEYGSSGHARAAVAISAGIWFVNNFVPTPGAGQSMNYDGEGNTAADWFAADLNFGEQNPCQFPEGDFDLDGMVTTSDMLLFFTAYGCQSDCSPFDLTGDDIVNTNDLLNLVSFFGNTCV